MPILRERCVPVEGSSAVLIGMPGSGKSTIGRMISRKNGYAWVDTDYLLEAWWGMPLQAIRDLLGLQDFLAAEEELISSLKLYRTVISTGGSVVYSTRAMGRLVELGRIVYLKAHISTIEARLGDVSSRGLAMDADQDIADVYSQRRPLYEKYAELTVETDIYKPEQNVETIISWLAK
ncbi:MAG: homoserine kinase [Desulfonatronovibrio sp.]